MPIYQFNCDICGTVFEKRLHMTDDKSSVVCPYGHTKVHQIHATPHIIFKGPGFYVTDSRAKSATHAAEGNR
jgi:putative FmdB family regulatory protein